MGHKLGTLCWSTELAGFPIELRQAGVDDFAVVYGKSFDEKLEYGRAAAKLGQAIMHALACESKLDNTDPGDETESPHPTKG